MAESVEVRAPDYEGKCVAVLSYWYVDEGGTPSSSTGPAVDHTTGTAAGNYMFIESSSPYFNTTAHLTTPFIDLSAANGTASRSCFNPNGVPWGNAVLNRYGRWRCSGAG